VPSLRLGSPLSPNHPVNADARKHRAMRVSLGARRLLGTLDFIK